MHCFDKIYITFYSNGCIIGSNVKRLEELYLFTIEIVYFPKFFKTFPPCYRHIHVIYSSLQRNLDTTRGDTSR